MGIIVSCLMGRDVFKSKTDGTDPKTEHAVDFCNSRHPKEMQNLYKNSKQYPFYRFIYFWLSPAVYRGLLIIALILTGLSCLQSRFANTKYEIAMALLGAAILLFKHNFSVPELGAILFVFLSVFFVTHTVELTSPKSNYMVLSYILGCWWYAIFVKYWILELMRYLEAKIGEIWQKREENADTTKKTTDASKDSPRSEMDNRVYQFLIPEKITKNLEERTDGGFAVTSFTRTTHYGFWWHYELCLTPDSGQKNFTNLDGIKINHKSSHLTLMWSRREDGMIVIENITEAITKQGRYENQQYDIKYEPKKIEYKEIEYKKVQQRPKNQQQNVIAKDNKKIVIDKDKEFKILELIDTVYLSQKETDTSESNTVESKKKEGYSATPEANFIAFAILVAFILAIGYTMPGSILFPTISIDPTTIDDDRITMYDDALLTAEDPNEDLPSPHTVLSLFLGYMGYVGVAVFLIASLSYSFYVSYKRLRPQTMTFNRAPLVIETVPCYNALATSESYPTVATTV